MNSNTSRIFIGPQEIAGYYGNLAKGFYGIGVDCDFITFKPHPFGYGGESKRPFLLRLASKFNNLKEKHFGDRYSKIMFSVLAELSTSLWFFNAIFRYDIFIFGFGKTLLRSNIDLPILKFLGKKVISNLGHGAEARPPYIDGAHQSFTGQPLSINFIYKLNKRNSKIVRYHQKYANIVLGAPLSTSQFAKSKIINSFVIGLPFHSGELSTQKSILNNDKNKYDNKPIRILHSPSHPAVKGTTIITQAIDNLIRRGYKIDFILIHGRPFNEVLSEIQKCDFVIDQLYSDTPMAGFATESAWFGKPAIVGGYGLEELKQFVSIDMWPPSKTCNPDEIEKAIEELIVDVELRSNLGKKAQKFVHEKWNSVEVAKRYLRLIDGDIPEEWWLDPKHILYLEGAGQPVDRSRQTILHLVEKFGIESLQLSHHRELEASFLSFAKEKQ